MLKDHNVGFISVDDENFASNVVYTKQVAESVRIPIIGIGAGSDVDGQVLVIHDLIGLTNAFNPRFLRRYMNLYEDMKTAIENYVSDVKSVDFPNQNEQY